MEMQKKERFSVNEPGAGAVDSFRACPIEHARDEA
jgi:hypothetical protein